MLLIKLPWKKCNKLTAGECFIDRLALCKRASGGSEVRSGKYDIQLTL